MISVRELRKSFDGQPVLKSADLDITDGETMVILGPSGQGKTVLIKSMVRLLEPDSGSVTFDGQDVLRLKRKPFREFMKCTAFVFQNSALFDFLSVDENLRLYLRMHNPSSIKVMDDEIIEALATVGLDRTVLNKFPEELSGGMRKRVAIARAIVKKPRYLFYDEPTTGLDKGNAEKISELIRALKARYGVTSIIVTHDIALMHDVSDRVALLKDGRIFFVGRRDEISPQTLTSLYEAGELNGL
jgi:phospholipid/cholesterol/gamma-HCH transport system ATP-binding protein